MLAAPIITTGVFDQELAPGPPGMPRAPGQTSYRALQDVTEEQAMADPRLYVSGREGWDVQLESR